MAPRTGGEEAGRAQGRETVSEASLRRGPAGDRDRVHARGRSLHEAEAAGVAQEDKTGMQDRTQIALDFSAPELTAEELLVWDVMRTRRGKAAAILGPEIEARTGIRYKQVQKIINTLRCHHQKLIGSGTFGYYIPETDQEVKDATYYLRHRAIMALVTASKIQRTSIEEIFHQAR